MKFSMSHNISMTHAGLASCYPITAVDEFNQPQPMELVGERPLTVYLDKHEIVTLMTVGSQPELLVLGYLRNQGLVTDITDIAAVQVDWQVAAAAVTTHSRSKKFIEKLASRTVTTGCGQGTVFGKLMDQLQQIHVSGFRIRQSTLYALLAGMREFNDVYQRAGAVHGCALCSGEQVDFFVEDVGRHNAVDAIAGYMWLNNVDGAGKIFYTTGRLTSEMVIKATQMGVPLLLSRSGATQMGLELARHAGLTMIARAKGKHFLVLNGAENIEFDAQIVTRQNC